MFKKKVFSSLLAAIFGLTLFSSSAFASTTLVVDNDALSSAPGYNTMSGSWGYYTGSGYNNDYRMISSSYFGSTSNASYGWVFNASNVTADHAVYLANANFTNPSTAYQLDYSNNYAYIDQNTAISGWNFLGTNTSDSSGSALFLDGAMSSTQGGTNAGADAAYISY
jgi:hypothetical protein